MSAAAWSTYYQAVSGAGKLSRLIKDTRQRLILADATINNTLPDPEQLSISRSWSSLSGTRDTLSGGRSRNASDNWQLPLEPYPSLKFWIKYESGLKLKDHSLSSNSSTDNVTWVKGYDSVNPRKSAQPVKRLLKDDNVTEGRVYSLFDGRTQYTETLDSADIRLTDLLISNDEVCFAIYMSPYAGAIFDENQEYTDLFYKIDSDEVAYGYRVRLKKDGALRFTIVDNYAVYDLETAAGVVPVYDVGDFDPLDYDPTDFQTIAGIPHQTDPDFDPVPDWKIYAFTYNILTHSLKIQSAWQNPDDPNDKQISIIAQTANPLDDTDLSMLLPCNEGNGTTLHDASGHENHGEFDETNPPSWVDGALVFDGDDQSVVIPHDSSLDAFSEFTLAFKIKLDQYPQTSTADHVFLKGFSGNGTGVYNPGCFKIFINGNGSDDLGFAGRNDSDVTRSMLLSDALSQLNQWYDVIISYDGTQYKLEVPGIGQTTLNQSGDVFTNSDDLWIGSYNHCFHGSIAYPHFVKGRAWTQDDIDYFASLSPSPTTNKGGFPIWMPPQPPEPEEPQPTLKPVEVVYSVAEPASPKTFQINDPASTTPFDDFYNVPGGEAVDDPEVERYGVADGSTTGGTQQVDFTSVYTLSPQTSKGDIDNDVSNEIFYGQRIKSTSSDMYGEYIGKIQMYIGEEGSTGGSVQIGVMKSNGTFIGFGDSIAVSSLPSNSYQSYTRENSSNADPDTGYQMQVGDAVGVKWISPSGSGIIIIQRGGSGNHYEGSNSYQSVMDESNDWNDNSSYSMAGQVWIGGYEEDTTVEPFHAMIYDSQLGGTKYPRVAFYQFNSPLEGDVYTRVKWRVRRKGTLSSATLRCVMRNASDTVVATFGSTVACSSISTSIQDLSFSNPDNNVAWQDGYRICLEYDTLTGVNDTTNYIEVNFNATGVHGTSLKSQYWEDVFFNPDEWHDLSPSGSDWAGGLYTGGNSFTPWIELNDVRKRYGAKINDTGTPDPSALDKTTTKATFILESVGSPEGPIMFKIYNGTSAVASSFTTLQASSVAVSETSYDFTWVFNAHVNQNLDRLVIEYNDGDASNYIKVKINTDEAAGAAGEGQKMIATEWVNNDWVDITNRDVSAIFYEGGVPDLSSRSRISIQANSVESEIQSKKITGARFKFKLKGSPPNSIIIRSRRGSDDTPIDLLGTIPTSELNTSTWVEKEVINRDAIHFQGLTDKISIEYEDGDVDNAVLVMVNDTTDFDGNNTIFAEYNSVQWSTIAGQDIVGELETGGFLYTPDPGTPFVAPPYAYSHNLFTAAGPGLGVMAPGDIPTTFTGMRVREFRIVAGPVNEGYDLTELENWVDNKHTVLPVPKGQVALCGYTTLKE